MNHGPLQARQSPSVAQITPLQAQQSVAQTGDRASALSDLERELHILNCGYLMQEAMKKWHETGDFGFRGEASRWKLLRDAAIEGRHQKELGAHDA